MTQEHDDSLITIGRKYRLNSKVLNEERPYWVHLPASYHDTIHAPQYYPVLYFLDGDYNFNRVVGVVDSMGGSLQIPEFIVVGIPHIDRTRDLTPTHTLIGVYGKEEEWLKTSGGGDTFLQFIKAELFPHIESNYRTRPYRVLEGHSFGGLLVLHALLNAPNMFQAHIAIDPSCWWDKELLAFTAKQLSLQGKELTGRTYMSLANSSNSGWDYSDSQDEQLSTKPSQVMEQTGRNFFAALEPFVSSDFSIKLQYFEAEDHGSVPLLSLYYGLLYIFEGYKPEGSEVRKQPSSIVDHFEAISERIGLTLRPPEGFVNGWGLYFLNDLKEIEKAFEILQINAANYPDSYNVYKSLAEAYEVKKETALAVEHYQKALALNPNVLEVKDQLSKLQESLGS